MEEGRWVYREAIAKEHPRTGKDSVHLLQNPHCHCMHADTQGHEATWLAIELVTVLGQESGFLIPRLVLFPEELVE